MNYIILCNTPIGTIGIEETNEHISKVYFNSEINQKNITIKETFLLLEAKQQLEEYFTGKRTIFTLPLAPSGTQFQKNIWHSLQAIPYGETRSYKQIAISVGNEKASRAVGMANNKNPIPIFIPCHRVIGSNGSLVGYAGGLDIKELLLDLEKKKQTL